MTQRARKRDFRDGSISEFFNSIYAHRSSASRMRLQWVVGRRKIVVVAGTAFAGGSTMLNAALTAGFPRR
jgi:hypothetical protein